MKISVIIPTLNEEERISAQLEDLTKRFNFHEIIVVDGGSNDHTVSLASENARVRVLESQPGRGRQMNEGAFIATGDVLLFLHVDVRLPTDAFRRIEETLQKPGVVAGAFKTWTVCDGEKRTWARFFLHGADLRSRYSRLPYGDQGIFVWRSHFESIGGYHELPLMEDLDLSRRLRKHGKIRITSSSVTVSGRRFLKRPIYYTVLLQVLPLLFRLRVPPRMYVKFYGSPR